MVEISKLIASMNEIVVSKYKYLENLQQTNSKIKSIILYLDILCKSNLSEFEILIIGKYKCSFC